MYVTSRTRRLLPYAAAAAVLAAAGLGTYSLLSDRTPAYYSAPAKDLEWFKDAKFGLMITWGPASLTGKEISWSRRGPRHGEDKSEQDRGDIPADEYDQLYLRFNPTQFDAARYVRLAQAAGARYLVFVTKHHDGFCMFDSRLTDYKITNSPIRRDLTAELAEACHKAGMRLGLYYSPVDWHHPDYHTPRHDQYIQYLHGQVRELCTRYGKVDLLWFDGLYWRTRDWDSDNLFKLIRGLQPDILINDRAALPGDFDTLDTEQRIGQFNDRRPWETCMPLGDQWSFKPGDQLKPAAECIRNLVQCAGAGGNLLLDIAPGPDGLLDPGAATRLQEIGQWLTSNGSSVYETRPGPFRPAGWGVSTHRGSTVYLHVLKPAANLSLPLIPQDITTATTLTGQPVQVAQSAAGIRITLPDVAHNAIDFIVVLQVGSKP